MMRIAGLWLFTTFAVFLLTSCDEAVDPILESDRNFTLFGTLDMAQDTQFVRVERIRDVLEPTPGPLDVRFTSTELETGIVREWRDSVVNFNDGSIGHVFYASLRVLSGHTYRLQVDDPDESVPTWAETTVPTLIDPVVMPESVQGGAGGAVGGGTQQVILPELQNRPFLMESWYRFMVAERTPFVDVVLPYEPSNGPDGPTGWQVTMDLRKDRLTLDSLFEVREYPLLGVGLRITVLDDAFVPPGGVFDPEILAQPGTFSNVQNGFGFIGSVARFSAEWLLSNESMNRLDYVSLADLFGKRADDVRQEILRLGPRPGQGGGNYSGLQ